MTTTAGSTPSHGVRGVLAIAAFRKLWAALALSHLGDWLSVLALTSFAAYLTADAGYTAQSFAVGGVLILKMLPALVLGPLAAAVADRFDRRHVMAAADVVRCGILVSVPLAGQLRWVFIATLLSECAALFWAPAKEATIPHVVSREQSQSATRLSSFTLYGAAPVAGVLFAGVSLLSRALSPVVAYVSAHPVSLALYTTAAAFLIAAGTVFVVRDIPWRAGRGEHYGGQRSVVGAIIDGRGPVGGSRLVRGLTLGMLGALSALGAVLGVARVYVDTLGGGNPAYGALFAAAFLGVALGLLTGPSILTGFSRFRLFGLSVAATGAATVLAALIQNLVLVVLFTFGIGAFAGIAWVTGHTLIGRQVEDGLRDRVYAYVRSLFRVTILLVLAVAPFAAGAIGMHEFALGAAVLHLSGINGVLLGSGLLTCAVGAAAYHRMDDRRGVSLWEDLSASSRGEPYRPLQERASGVFVAFEGGEGSGKTTQVRALAVWLRDQGFDVTTTREPGATRVGMRLRGILLDKTHDGLSPRAEALMYAADRAEHVDSVIRPGLERGAIVITDRFLDSTLAYQGEGRRLSVDELSRLNRYATGGLVPDLTVLLDVPASEGLARFGSPADRMESEPSAFHERVRQGFRALAERDPGRYLVVDAALPVDEVARRVQERLRPLLPDPVPLEAEAHTHSMPAIRVPRDDREDTTP